MGFVRPPLRDRTVLYLLGYTGYEESHELPQGLTQAGMAKALGAKRAQVAQVLIELKDKEMARERVCHIKGSPRRMKAFVLTPTGRGLGENLRRSVLEQNVSFTDETGAAKDMTVKDLLELYPKQLDITGALRVVDDDGDLSAVQVKEFLDRPKREAEEEAAANAVQLECDNGDKAPEGAEAAPQPVWAQPAEGAATAEAPPAAGTEQYPQDQSYQQAQPYQYGQEQYQPDYVQQYYQTYGQYPPGYQYQGYQQTAAQPAVQPTPPKRPPGGRISFLLGVIVIGLALFMGVLQVGSSIGEVCIIPLLLIFVGAASILNYYVGMRKAKVEVLDKKDRYLVLGVAFFMAFFLAFFTSIAVDFNDFEWNDTVFQNFLWILVPLLFVLGAFFIIPAHVRGQIGMVIGTFLIALAISGLMNEKAFSWVYIHPVMWLATGALAAAVGNEVARPDKRQLGLWISTGIGVYLIFVPLALIDHILKADASDLFIRADRLVLAVAVLLWFGLGLVIVGLRFAKKERIDGLFASLGYMTLVAIGTAFGLFGVWFMRVGRFEGAIDLLVGLPVIYYALIQAKGSAIEDKRPMWAMMGYAVLVEVVSLGLLLDFFG